MLFKRLQFLVVGLSLIGVTFVATPSQAWKIDTHIWLAKELYEDVKKTGKVRLPVGEFPIPPNVWKAIEKHEGPFLLGVLGPDTYPDMIAGQMTTHPGVEGKKPFETAVALASIVGQPLFKNAPSWQTDDWLNWVRSRALATSAEGPEVAFAYGYLIHAAMDMWAHTYVNLYAGDVFSLFDEQEVEFRHMAIESLVARTHKSYLPDSQALSNQEATRRLGNQLAEPHAIRRASRSRSPICSTNLTGAAEVRGHQSCLEPHGCQPVRAREGHTASVRDVCLLVGTQQIISTHASTPHRDQQCRGSGNAGFVAGPRPIQRRPVCPQRRGTSRQCCV